MEITVKMTEDEFIKYHSYKDNNINVKSNKVDIINAVESLVNLINDQVYSGRLTDADKLQVKIEYLRKAVDKLC